MVICDPRDRFTQEDVNNYLSDIKVALEEASKSGQAELDALERELCKRDIYYLGLFILGINKMYSENVNGEEVFHPWIFNRCREVEAKPDYCIDIWAREHFKSTIITLLMSIHEILNNPEVAICVYSYNATIARKFVRQIREAMENPRLRELFPDIIPQNPRSGKYKIKDDFGKEQEKKFSWSDENFTVIRKTMRKEPTVSGYGLVTGQPTGMHFDILTYDDVVTPDSVRTKEQNRKTTEQWKMSLNTGSGESVKVRIVGTRYDLYDTYFAIMNPMYEEKGIMGGSKFTERIKPCRLEDGTTVLYTPEYIKQKENTMIGFVFWSQMMCNPIDSSSYRFKEEWLIREPQEKIFKEKDRCNWYILVDPANSKNKKSDYTGMAIVGCRDDGKYVLADAVRAKLSPFERYETLFAKVQKWAKGNVYPEVWYEQSGLSSDQTIIMQLMREKNFWFTMRSASTRPIINIDPRMGATSGGTKAARIFATEPLFRNHRIVIADEAMQQTDRGLENVMQTFIMDEYTAYPFTNHEDLFDAFCRIADAETGAMMIFPSPKQQQVKQLGPAKSNLDPYQIRPGSFIPY